MHIHGVWWYLDVVGSNKCVIGGSWGCCCRCTPREEITLGRGDDGGCAAAAAGFIKLLIWELYITALVSNINDRQVHVCRMVEKLGRFMMLGEEGFKSRWNCAKLTLELLLQVFATVGFEERAMVLIVAYFYGVGVGHISSCAAATTGGTAEHAGDGRRCCHCWRPALGVLLMTTGQGRVGGDQG